MQNWNYTECMLSIADGYLIYALRHGTDEPGIWSALCRKAYRG